MAKRKRLTPPAPDSVANSASRAVPDAPAPGPAGPALGPLSRAPIAQVAGDVALESAFQEVRGELESARSEGRMVVRLPLGAVDEEYLIRDRMAGDDDDMKSLAASIAARGQQTPIEVVALGDGRYGLISGWRRLRALRALADDGADPGAAARHATVLALVRRPQDQADAYVAMIEENEIRAALSYYERANVAAEAAAAGVFPNVKVAVSSLYSSVTSAKRSKISRFVVLRDALGEALAFPTAIPEKLGLALVTAIEADAAFAARLGDTLRKTAPEDASAERAVLERALKKAGAKASTTAGAGGAARPAKTKAARPEASGDLVPGLSMTTNGGMIVLSGDMVDQRFVDGLKDWVFSHAKTIGAID